MRMSKRGMRSMGVKKDTLASCGPVSKLKNMKALNDVRS